MRSDSQVCTIDERRVYAAETLYPPRDEEILRMLIANINATSFDALKRSCLLCVYSRKHSTLSTQLVCTYEQTICPPRLSRSSTSGHLSR